jgi:hypothetical protein
MPYPTTAEWKLVCAFIGLEQRELTIEHGLDIQGHQFVPAILWEVFVGSTPVNKSA